MKVRELKYNWRQAGSTIDRDGAGEDYDSFTVGEKGVILIEENEPFNGMQLWNYIIHFQDNSKVRIFNPNFVEYFPDNEVKEKFDEEIF